MSAFASMLWERYRVTATSSPAALRWNARDYRDAADLAFRHDPKMQADLRACANGMDAAAWLLDLHRGGVTSSPVGAATGATDGVVPPGSGPVAAVDPPAKTSAGSDATQPAL